MKSKTNWLWMIAGIVNLATALLHTIGGQFDLVNPMLQANLADQAKAEWLGAWHMITIILFLSSYAILVNARKGFECKQIELMRFIGAAYILFAIPSGVSSIAYQVLAPQWILLLPIGVLVIGGVNQSQN